MNPEAAPAVAPAPPERSVFARYQSPEGSYDEARDATGRWRPAWEPLLSRIEELGSTQLAIRWHRAQRIIRENGVTYNAFGDPRGTDRPWELDPIPFVIAPEEWHALERGLVQRARLLGEVLADIYGPQRLVTEGLVPAPMLFSDGRFLRPSHGVKPAGGLYLPILAVDLGRGPDGRWRVLADRAEALVGAGYALENRIAVSRLLPNKFRTCGVHRLAEFFSKVRDLLVRLSPRQGNPRIVLLTGGAYDPTYFEHVFVSRYLGFTLVEGADLTVRGSQVYLKTLRGLYSVDAIIRRISDDHSDPMEFDGGSLEGVAGFLRAVRGGNLAVVNPLGAGIIESPAIGACLPACARKLLGEDLLLEGLATWWCGDPDMRAHVLSNVERLAVRTLERKAAPTGVRAAERVSALEDGPAVERASPDELRRRIEEAPQHHAACERLRLSCAPAWQGDGAVARHVMVRAYVVAVEGGYRVMPGGLTLTSSNPEAHPSEPRSGDASKDTWVISDGPVSSFSLLRSSAEPIPLIRGGYYLPSRVADNLFWLGRYAERAEGQLRLLAVLLGYLADESVGSHGEEVAVVLDALHQILLLHEAPEVHIAPDRIESQLLELVFDPQRPASLRNVVAEMERVASRIRDRLTADSWRTISNLDLVLDAARPQTLNSSDAVDVLARVLPPLEAFSGMTLESMTRGQGWHFLDMGRRLERAVYTARLLSAAWVSPGENPLAALEPVLQITNSLMTYRSRYLTNLQAGPAIDLILMDETNPRSMAFQLASLVEHEAAVSDAGAVGRSEEAKLILKTLTTVRCADAHALAEIDGEGRRPRLSVLLDDLAADLPAVTEVLTRHYFSPAQPTRSDAHSVP